MKAERAVKDLQRALETAKRDSAGYFAEIEVIAKEFESAQEQNSRLLAQLSEKDDTTTKLMSEVYFACPSSQQLEINAFYELHCINRG